jgi:hypothetical protein
MSRGGILQEGGLRQLERFDRRRRLILGLGGLV